MPVTVRPATAADVPALGRMGAALARQHHAFDPRRFMLPDDVERGYRAWLARELAQDDARVLVAEISGAPCGYAYGRIEERDWNALLERCGYFHDLWVDEAARGQGAGGRLAEEMVRSLEALGVPRVVLMTAAANAPARRLFERLGWRTTMLELTREASPPRP